MIPALVVPEVHTTATTSPEVVLRVEPGLHAGRGRPVVRVLTTIASISGSRTVLTIEE